jgi:hypothetical protein
MVEIQQKNVLVRKIGSVLYVAFSNKKKGFTP